MFKDRRAGQIAGHHDHGVAEINGAALGIGEPAVIQHLQQQVEHIGMGLLHFIEKQHRIGPATHGLRELPPFLVTDVARRSTDQPGHGVPLHELAHVEANQRLLFIKQRPRQRLRQLGLADAGRPQEQEGTHRSTGILHAGPGPADGSSNGGHRLALTNHPFSEMGVEIQEFAPLARQQPLHGNPGPTGHQISDVTGLHLLAQQSRSSGLGLRLGRLQFIPALLHPMQLVVLEAGRFLQVTIPLGLSDGMAQVFVLLEQLAELLELTALLLPAPPQIVQSRGHFKPVALELNPLRFRGLLGSEQGQFNAA